MILVAAPAGEYPAHLAIALLQAIFLSVFGAVGDAVLDAARNHGAVFRVHALQVIADRQPTGEAGVDAMQLGEMRIGDKAVFADVPIPGADSIGRSQGQLQALLGFPLGFEAFFRASLQFQSDAAAFVGFDRGDEDSGDLRGLITNRAIGQIQPEVGFSAVSLQGEASFAVGANLAL